FFEPLAGPRIAESLARTTGAKTAVLDPIEGLTDEQRQAGKSYLSLMKENLAALAEGLGCKLS
ncbi:MAG: metal ABC transporter solute-binding protein, Zn/Mn family, partial [Actinomycetota bacterium]